MNSSILSENAPLPYTERVKADTEHVETVAESVEAVAEPVEAVVEPAEAVAEPVEAQIAGKFPFAMVFCG